MPSLEWTLSQALWQDIRPPVVGTSILSPSAERPTWVQIMDRDTPATWRNAIFHSELAPEKVDDEIERVVSEYREVGLPVLWYVTPITRPINMWSHLQRHGFIMSEVLEGMAIEVNELLLNEDTEAPIEIEEVTLESFDTWLDLFQRGWMIEREIAAGLGSAIRKAMQNGTNGSRRFFACYDGIPAGIASMKRLPDAMHLYSTVILPEFRKKGVYSKLLAHRRDEARRAGVPTLTVHCIPESSAPICRKLGFREVCRIEVWQKSL